MLAPAHALAPTGARDVSTHRLTLADGAATSLHVAWYARARTAVRIVRLPRPAPLAGWCRTSGAGDALVGGFYVRPGGVPLGELWLDGRRAPSVPFDAPWGALRACVAVSPRGAVRIARRPELARRPGGALLQAGPLLLRDGEPVVAGDPEGFSAGAGQFDSDITACRHPRAALGVADGWLAAVVCDGRAEDEAGLTLEELADVLARLGITDALNLDGGGSASLVVDGRLRNVPREAHGIPLVAGRPITTALAFTPR